MVNRAKAKGTAAETAVLNHLADLHPDAYRPAQAGYRDRGDIIIPSLGAVIEVKNRADMAAGIREGLDQLDAELVNSGMNSGVLVAKPRGVGLANPGRFWTVRRLEDDPIVWDR